MVDLGARARGEITRIAVVMDVRSRAFTTDLAAVIKDLDGRGYPPRLLFLEASDAVLVRRFEQVRRSHPLQGDGRLVDGIAASASCSRPLREAADLVVDTSTATVPTLRATLERAFGADYEHRHARHASCPSATSTACRWTPTSSSTCASCPTRSGSPSCATRPAATSRCATTCSPRRAAGSSSTATWSCWASSAAGYRREGKRYLTVSRRLHRRQAPQRGHQRGDRAAAGRRSGMTVSVAAPRPGARMSDTAATDRSRPSPSAAATGCTPRSRRCALLTDDVTAVVTVADDGGSSGRLRRELGLLPPGDLRMAICRAGRGRRAGPPVAHPRAAPLRRHRRAGGPRCGQPAASPG